MTRYIEVEEKKPNALFQIIGSSEHTGWAKATAWVFMLSEFIIPLFLLLPFGLLALHSLKKHPEKKGKGIAWAGVIVGAFFYAFLYFIFGVVG